MSLRSTGEAESDFLAFKLPPSSFLDAETHELLRHQQRQKQAFGKLCPFSQATYASAEAAIDFRHCCEKHYTSQLIEPHKARFSVEIKPETIAGVYTEVFTPIDGDSADNRARILINLHGGGFIADARSGGQIESIPIAAVGQIKVVSVDYRMAPEWSFPAATEDVTNIYRALLRDYKPENIGIYGFSAGALLTAQTVVWLQKEDLPRPGAVGMFGAAGAYWGEGDSGHLYAAGSGLPLPLLADPRHNPYFKNVDPNDPLAFPLRSMEQLCHFPPSLLVTATRDLALSSVVHMHRRLVEVGVTADLHVWEGLGHGFQYFPELPASQQLYRIAANFFETHLGR